MSGWGHLSSDGGARCTPHSETEAKDEQRVHSKVDNVGNDCSAERQPSVPHASARCLKNEQAAIEWRAKRTDGEVGVRHLHRRHHCQIIRAPDLQCSLANSQQQGACRRCTSVRQHTHVASKSGKGATATENGMHAQCAAM